MANAPKKLGSIHTKILELLKSNPNGLTIYEIRERIPDLEVQQHLDKRVRELRYFFDIPIQRIDGKSVYVFQGERKNKIEDDGHIPSRLRAKILHESHGKCQMCGRSIAQDNIKLEIDHKIPRNWGGQSVEDNLWAICQLCNSGKRDFFSTFNDAEMKSILAFDSVYDRIAETLRLYEGKPTPSWLLQFVSNSDDYQEDWQKRLRELRYPVIGLEISVSRKKNEHGKVEAFYTLDKWKPLPENHKFLIKEFERLNKKAKMKD